MKRHLPGTSGREHHCERGQAYTLEGFIAAMVILMAVLFALQAVVITPTTGGSVDRSVLANTQQEAQDALVIAAHNDSERNLSGMIRYWNHTGGEDGEGEYYGHSHYGSPYNTTQFADEFVLGELLYERFAESGDSYSVVLVYQDGSGGFNETSLVHQGSSEAITASYTVTLYNDQNLTAPGSEGVTLENASTFPIPAADNDDEHVYNVVEVRVILW